MNEVKEPQIAYRKRYFTEKEYLLIEEVAIEKSEYYQGEIFAMAGASIAHNEIFKNVFLELGLQTKGKKCTPYGSDMRLHVPENTLYTYPDITFYCKKEDDEKNIGDPTVIIEILSTSTKEYDKGIKFELYRDLKTLKEYITIDSEAIRVDRHFINNNGNWETIELKKISDTLKIDYLHLQMTLQEIYANVF